MPQASIGADFLQPFDIQLHLATQITFNPVVAVDVVTQGSDLSLGQILYAGIWIDSCGFS